MKNNIFLIAFFSYMQFYCRELTKIRDCSVFPPEPMIVPFGKDEIADLFPVVNEYGIGLVHDEQWAIATIKNGKIHLDDFPEREFSSMSAKGLPQKKPNVVFVKDNKSLALLDWSKKRLVGEFCDISNSIEINLERSKVIDYHKGIAISLFEYFDKGGDDIHQFVIDDILNKKRLKVAPIPHHIPPLSVYFTPSFIFYQYSQTDYESPWMALDNDLNEVRHPLSGLLNANARKPAFNVYDDNMFVSEKLEHALIISYDPLSKKDMLFLVAWYGYPRVQPVVVDELEIGARRLFSSPNRNCISPSGKWVYFAANGHGKLPDTHYIIHLDPTLPNGYLPPFKLDIEGNVACAGWMTSPEGLVLYKEPRLWHFDLSHFDNRNGLRKSTVLSL
jgi:hypothetical protein